MAIVGLLVYSPMHVMAQDTASARATTAQHDPGWYFSVSPYLWAAGVKGNVGVKGVSAPVDESFSDILSQFQMGLMVAGEAQHGRWLINGDLLYISLNDKESVSIDLFPNVTHAKTKQHQFMFSPTVGYVVAQGLWGMIDVSAGIRYWYNDIDVSFSTSDSTVFSRSGSVNWVDGIAGGRIRGHFASRWRYIVMTDLGGGGTRFTWHYLVGAGYDFNKLFTLQLGYRYLSVDYRHSGVINDTQLHGPYLGATFRF